MSNTYDNWRAITESDFVTLFIKTWFAFVATMRVLHPLNAEQSEKGDGTYINRYKDNFHEAYFSYMKFEEVKDDFYKVYKDGLKIVTARYPKYLFKDFFSINQQLNTDFKEDMPIKLKLKIKKNRGECIKCTLCCSDRAYLEKIGADRHIIEVEIAYNDIIQGLIEDIKSGSVNVAETALLPNFYCTLKYNMLNVLIEKINEVKSTIPVRGNKRFLQNFDIMTNFCNTKLQSWESLCVDHNISNSSKLLYQIPYASCLFRIEDGETPNEVEQLECYLWFVSFAYRLRNALFHEIIDPLNEEWQLIFKSAYLVLKQIVDGNIEYLKNRGDSANL